MARQRIPMIKGEVFGAALITMVVVAVGILPRVMYAETAKATLEDSLRCMQQNPGCTPTPPPTNEAVPPRISGF
ncbi:MAG: hypothetical protein NTW91_10805 [Verrucomicrobia bacterium]|nr:hypothetical protein [Verrucomicrobiota bacterium]